ncbi:pseudouridine synthase [Glycocaulis albus]|uniref:Pseudouridine synthase n=1 Tax=Glycocaulis albus TaxID=1382801 RepID=A0ABQ1Y041_9PROT|nr:RluA family pseudouridine synthase [Glycocaulis albus]MBV5258205.1 RluA family pseudouridine synthase [Synechococcus moorigangaii CMS01]GGH07629.1 pseudouridine synthase [Glycocaulis albus]
MSKVETRTVAPDEADIRLDRWFRRHFPHVTHGALEKLLRTGQVRVDGGRVKGNHRLEPGQEIRIPPLPEPGEAPPPKTISAEDKAFARSMVLYEDDTLIALNKPPGLPVQGGSKVTRHLDGLLDAFGTGEKRPRLVHRLDKDTSGVIVVAKGASNAAWLASLFKGRDLEKTYWAIALGIMVPRAGEITGYMKKTVSTQGDRELMVAARHGEEGAQYALTRYATADEAGRRASWVVLRPETGRTHQLRVHLAAAGHAIQGDGKYTCDVPPLGGVSQKLHLHARKLVIPREGKKPLVLEAPLSKHMADTFEALGFDPDMEMRAIEAQLG